MLSFFFSNANLWIVLTVLGCVILTAQSLYQRRLLLRADKQYTHIVWTSPQQEATASTLRDLPLLLIGNAVCAVFFVAVAAATPFIGCALSWYFVAKFEPLKFQPNIIDCEYEDIIDCEYED
jgi:hypothetical protein